MVIEEFKIRPIHADAIPEALARARQYRLLAEPEQAESICRDILRVEPDHQPTLVTLILALTDQFSHEQWSTAGVRIARDYVQQLTDEFAKVYYAGLIHERQARALLKRGMPGAFAYDGLREAMDLYEQAEPISPPGNGDAILRWNSCVRTIRRAKLQPRHEEQEPLLE